MQAHEFWIPFADIARDFEMIEGGMEPVIIPMTALRVARRARGLKQSSACLSRRLVDGRSQR